MVTQLGYKRSVIPLTRPWIGDEEIEALTRVARSGMLVQGVEVERFEATMAELCGRAHAIAVSNGTSALALCLQALEISGGEVVVPALTWPSPAYAATAVGAKVRIVDVDADEWNASAPSADGASAVVAIDQFGVPVRAEGFDALGVPVIEDAACAVGSRFGDGRPCGSLGLASCFSFHPRKLLTTGEGGMIVTDDEGFAQRLRQLRNHGQAAPGKFAEAALNHRLTDLQAAVGNAQLERLEDTLRLRREHASAIRAALPAARFQTLPEGAVRNEQTLGILVDDRDAFIARCREAGVGCGRLTYSLSEIDFLPAADTPVANDIAARGVALPLYPQMSAADRQQVIDVVGRVLEGR